MIIIMEQVIEVEYVAMEMAGHFYEADCRLISVRFL